MSIVDDRLPMATPGRPAESLAASHSIALWRALTDPAAIWAGVATCPTCGRPVAGPDCDWDPTLCWEPVSGGCQAPSSLRR